MTAAIRPTGVPQEPSGTLDRVVRRFYPLAQKSLVVMPLLAFAGPFASVRPGSAGFPYAYRILFVLLLVVAVPLFLTRLRRRVFPWAGTLLLLGWVGWTSLSLLWTPDRGAGVREIFAGSSALLGAWVTLILSRGSARSLRYLRWGWMLALGVTVLVVVFEIVSWRHLGELTGAVEYWVFSAYTVAGLDTNPNGLSNFVNAAVAVLCAQLIREVRPRRAARAAIDTVEYDGPPPDRARGRWERGSWWRIGALLLALVVAAYLSLLTNSRSGVLVVLVLCVGAAVFCLPSRTHRLVPVALVAIAVAVLPLEQVELDSLRVQPTEQPADVKNRPTSRAHESMTAAQQAADLAAADSLRRDLLSSGLRQVEQRPLQGFGAGAALTRLEQDPQYQPGADAKTRRILPLHNTFLEMAVNYGIPFVLLILAVPLLAAAAVLRPRALLRHWPDPIVFECLAMLLAFVVMSVITSSSIGTPIFWLMLAYAVALAWHYTDTLTSLDRRGTDPVGAPGDPGAPGERGRPAERGRPGGLAVPATDPPLDSAPPQKATDR